MAIAPVKTGNVTTPPPVKPADSKLTAQFNGAVKAGEKGSGPSTSTKPPFFTPHEGSFRDVRKIGGKAYNTRLKWTVNENQQSNTNKVFIRGTITVDYGNTKTSYAIDGNNSYINSDGSVIYQSNFISTTPYKTRYNIFSSIEKGVKAALKAVLNNKTYFNFNNTKAPVSMASAALTQALMPVGEVNLLNGIGLNGAGARIKNELNNQLSKTDTADDKVRIRQSIALAIRGAGVKIPVNGTIPEKLSKQSEPNTQAMADVEHLAATHMIETITNGERRRLGIHNRRMTEDDALTLAIAVNRIVTQPDNLRNYARHVANQLAERGVLFWDGVTVVDRETWSV